MCGRECCKSLARREPPSQILAMECAVCKEERSSKVLVARGADDPRFGQAFQAAPLIVPNNDVKFHTNKKRSLEFAHRQGKSVVWSQAKDVASEAVLASARLTQDTMLQRRVGRSLRDVASRRRHAGGADRPPRPQRR